MTTVHEHVAATRARDLPREDQRAVIRVDGLLRKIRTKRILPRHVEHRLDAEPVAARADRRRGDAAAEHRAERVDEDRLARARLAREDVQPCAERDFDVLQERKVPDRQRFQHADVTLLSAVLC